MCHLLVAVLCISLALSLISSHLFLLSPVHGLSEGTIRPPAAGVLLAVFKQGGNCGPVGASAPPVVSQGDNVVGFGATKEQQQQKKMGRSCLACGHFLCHSSLVMTYQLIFSPIFKQVNTSTAPVRSTSLNS